VSFSRSDVDHVVNDIRNGWLIHNYAGSTSIGEMFLSRMGDSSPRWRNVMRAHHIARTTGRQRNTKPKSVSSTGINAHRLGTLASSLASPARHAPNQGRSNWTSTPKRKRANAACDGGG
jgi:hypothetical protein